MNTARIFLFVIGIACITGCNEPKAPEPKHPLEGSWTMTAALWDHQRMPEWEGIEIVFLLTGDSGTYSLNASPPYELFKKNGTWSPYRDNSILLDEGVDVQYLVRQDTAAMTFIHPDYFPENYCQPDEETGEKICFLPLSSWQIELKRKTTN